MKKDLSAELREIYHNLEEIANRVSAVEDRETGHDKEVERLQLEVLHMHEHIELQTHAEDLENRSQRNIVRIRGVPTQAEGSDLDGHVKAVFRHILGATEDIDIKLDRVHRVGPPQPEGKPPADIRNCVHDFQ
ncbi:hypothetical protein NDU88_008986 [Pleurodeles waltl]|uniref:Uncharacterized protein n=1 Tax=Pleurodeles waltl TaxID=8319 RepID=A0AAV7RX29_PLEWA|nr:hypothetical protein NDU88_008986 [Pleurodeles waltl]